MATVLQDRPALTYRLSGKVHPQIFTVPREINSRVAAFHRGRTPLLKGVLFKGIGRRLGEGEGALRLPRDGADFDPKLRG